MSQSLPTWREMNRDTTPEAEAVLIRLWRETPAWRKWELMEDLNRAARELALACVAATLTTRQKHCAVAWLICCWVRS